MVSKRRSFDIKNCYSPRVPFSVSASCSTSRSHGTSQFYLSSQELTVDLHAVSNRAFIPFNISEVFSLLIIKIILEEDLDSARVDNLTVGIISSNRVLFSVARTQLHQYLLSEYGVSIDLSWVLLDRSSYDLYQRSHSTSVIFILRFACMKNKIKKERKPNDPQVRLILPDILDDRNQSMMSCAWAIMKVGYF